MLGFEMRCRGNVIWRRSPLLWCSTNAEENTAVPLVVFSTKMKILSVLACWGVHVDFTAEAVMHISVSLDLA